ncbi:LysR family transcriptional regulator [Salipiger mucosus]|uniref:Transcriptional regulatory protein n=1 Tax=Salipiger mucosus DSM 16094 TaxID=1123237 RepID=S9R268_9RHOB|nr:LysR family transcriptional regulator [Salipiger mucosus]EPX85987.1 transcriptional regulatory protein [Salipiger mucosus DSM 16094]
MPDKLDWNDVRFFLETARARQMSRAGKRMGVSHTTVARHVERIETLLQTKLFEPGADGLTPTEAGAALMPLAEDMEARAVTIRDLFQRPGGLAGRVRIGAPDGFGNAVLSRLLPGLCAQEPNLTVELVPLPATHKLSTREVDIAVSLDRPESGRMIMQRLADYDLRLYASRDFVARHGLPQTRDALAALPFVGYIDELLYTRELDFNRKIHPGIVTRYKAATVQAQLDAILAGAGLGVLPCFITRGRDLVTILPDEIAFSRAYWLLFSEDDRENSRVRRVADYIRTATQAEAASLRHAG